MSLPPSTSDLLLQAQGVTGLEQLASQLAGLRSRGQVLQSTALIADRTITVQCDDCSFFPHFLAMFGGSVPQAARMPAVNPVDDVHVEIRACANPNFGWFRVTGRDDLPVDGHEFKFAVELERGLFQELPTLEQGWRCFGFRGAAVPTFAFRGRDCLFARDALWGQSITWYLFWRLLRIRSDAIFFHAAALGVHGEGTIFVGPSGAGKSTTALALAARGHMFLSDEVAGFLPASGELVPFRRPVGIKPGPRAVAVERGLSAEAVRRIEDDGFARVPVETLFEVAPARQLPLRRIVFLRGFAPRPSLERIAPGRQEIAELQPLMSSFLNAPHSRRVFELTRLMSRAMVYQLHLGDPDDSATYIENSLASQ